LRYRFVHSQGDFRVTVIASKFGIDINTVKKLDLPSSAIRKLSDEEIAKFKKIQEMAYSKPANLDELKNHISQKPYAEVKVGGQLIATIYNNGTSSTSNALGGKINKIIEELDSKLSGPEGAQARAEAIAKAFGGTVVKSKTAVTQAQYLATPAFEVKYEVDYEAMNAALGRVATPQTATDTQSLGSDEAAGKSVVDEFLDFTSMSWEEKVRAMILKTMGLREEDLAAMSAEDREKIEAKIKEKIEAEIEKKTGMAVGSL